MDEVGLRVVEVVVVEGEIDGDMDLTSSVGVTVDTAICVVHMGSRSLR